MTALGRELLGFVWAIAVRAERQQKLRPLHDDRVANSDVFPDSSADDSGGPTKRRTLVKYYAVRFPDPTRATSPRQLPTDHVHAVPTREYQCDQSSRLLLGCHRPAVQNPKPKALKAHQRERVPPTPARRSWSIPERCSPSRVRFAAPNCGAPLTAPRRSGQTMIATGGSGGNTDGPRKKQRPAFLPLVGTPAQIKTPSNPGGLDRVAYRNRSGASKGHKRRRMLIRASTASPHG